MINYASYSNARAQFDLTNHMSLPSLSLEKTSLSPSPEFTLSSHCGSAAEVSFLIRDRCYFRHEDALYALEILQPTKNIAGIRSIDLQDRAITFKPTTRYTELAEARIFAINQIHSRYPEATFISIERSCEVSFFDHQNQQRTWSFSEDDCRLQTTSPVHGSSNTLIVGASIQDKVPYEDALAQCLNDIPFFLEKRIHEQIAVSNLNIAPTALHA